MASTIYSGDAGGIRTRVTLAENQGSWTARRQRRIANFSGVDSSHPCPFRGVTLITASVGLRPVFFLQ